MKIFPSLALLVTLVSCPGARAAESLTVAAVGDIMMGTTWPEEVLPPRDGEGIFDNVLESFHGADIVFGNLEGPLADGGEGVKCKKKRRPGKSLCFEFRTPTRFAKHLESAGFNVMNVANNHAFDFGPEGVESTIEALCEAGIQAVGGDNVAAFCVRGKTVAVVGFSYSPLSPHSYPLLDIPEGMEIVGSLKEENDLVLVSFHGGAEGKDALRVMDAEEIFAGENRGNVVRFARAVIDAGADLVIGHGPHVPRAMEIYKGKLIAYSLGNFLTYGRFNIQGPSGVSLVLKVSIDMETGNFAGGEIVPVELLDRGIPYLDPEKKSVTMIRDLTASLPGPGLVIGEDGVLIPVPPQEEEPGDCFDATVRD
jgi:poly-gamma-glutamate capsule biosynthesis protein CapA/YwtB (metallophosphatase superfamily)